MRVVEARGSRLSRILVLAAVLVGLVGMHHLVAAGCAALSHSVDHSAHEVMNSEFEPVPAVSPTTPEVAESSSSADLAGAGGVCLAILITVAVVISRRGSWPISAAHVSRFSPPLALVPQSSDPPDLVELSISRT